MVIQKTVIHLKCQQKQTTMKTLQTTNRTFNNKVKELISKNLNKVVSYKKVDNKTVRLMNSEGETIALWNQTFNGSEVVLNTWY